MSLPGNVTKKSTREAVEGILLLDKPLGMTSNQALQEAKRILNARKAGHTGSLDPIATGLLPLCFGESTKISRFLLEAKKRYRTTFRLGQSTSTGDAEGEVISEHPVTVDRKAVVEALEAFRGRFTQVPPMYSALKRNGQPLYKLARQGIEVEREARDVEVYDLQLLAFDREAASVELELECSRGFYLRSLAQDLGEALGCGAHVVALRRLGVANFDISDAVTLEALREHPQPASLLLGPDEGLSHLPGVRLSRDATFYLCRGQPVRAIDPPANGWVRLYAESARFLGVGIVLDDGRVAPKRLFLGDNSG